MTAQQQAFKAYYSSLTDAELLKIAANRHSFLAVAQEVLDGELRSRDLASIEPSPSAGQTAEASAGLWARMARSIRGAVSRKR